MENIKIPFFKRLKKAITEFESYSNFAVEKLSVAIKYFAKLMLIFSIVVSIVASYKFSTIVNDEEQLQIMYNEMAENGIDLQLLDETINYIKDNNSIQLYVSLALGITVYIFGIFLLVGLLDAVLVSILALILSRIVRILLKYKPIFIMSLYALTLPIILNCIYIVANTLTGFTIEYFTIVYNVIAYIYVITAVLMIKTDFIEQQRELVKIIQEQEKVKQEQNNEEGSEQKEKQEEKKEEIPPNKEPHSEPET